MPVPLLTSQGAGPGAARHPVSGWLWALAAVLLLAVSRAAASGPHSIGRACLSALCGVSALGAVNLPTTVVEWWQDSPQAAPYTFRIEVHSSQGVSDALYHQIRQLTDRAKNLRSHLSKIDVLANIGMDGAFYISGATTAHIDVDIFAGESHG